MRVAALLTLVLYLSSFPGALIQSYAALCPRLPPWPTCRNVTILCAPSLLRCVARRRGSCALFTSP